MFQDFRVQGLEFRGLGFTISGLALRVWNSFQDSVKDSCKDSCKGSFKGRSNKYFLGIYKGSLFWVEGGVRT